MPVIDSDDNAKKTFQVDDKVSEGQQRGDILLLLNFCEQWKKSHIIMSVTHFMSFTWRSIERYREKIYNKFLPVCDARGTRAKNTSKFQFESRSSKWYVVVVVVAFECLSMITEMSHVFLYVSSFFFSCFFPTLIIDLIFLLTDQAQAQHRSTWMVERGKNSWNYFVDDISSVIKNWC